MTKIKSEYELQAEAFLEKTGVSMEVKFLKNDFHFTGDKEKRDIYKITLTRGERKMVLNFGQSLNDSGFYFTQGRAITEIDRKFLNLKNLELRTKLQYLHLGLRWQSCDKIHYPIAPTSYCVLAVLQKYDVGTLQNFCEEFGYDLDSKSAEKTFLSVQKEFADVQRIWTDQEIEEMQEIN